MAPWTGSRGWRTPQLRLLEGSASAASPSPPLPALVTPFSKKPSKESATPTRLLQGLATDPRQALPARAGTHCCRDASAKPFKGFGVVGGCVASQTHHGPSLLLLSSTNSQLRGTVDNASDPQPRLTTGSNPSNDCTRDKTTSYQTWK